MCIRDSVNTARNDPVFGGTGANSRDVLQYVFWGDDRGADDPRNLDDDNIHATGYPGEKWPYYSTRDVVQTRVALNSDNSALYANSNGYIYAIDPADGSSLWAWPHYFYLSANSSSAPAVDASDQIIAGDDYGDGYINSTRSSGSGYNWFYEVDGDVRSNPVIASNGIVYFGTESGYFYAFNNNTSSGTVKWFYDIGGGYDIKGSPDLSPDESTVYFASIDSHYIYALRASDGFFKWRLNLLGPVYSSPRVADDGTIYIGSDGGSGVGYLWAINPNGTQKWRYSFTPTNPHCRPTIGADGTIYIGNDDTYLYAITDEGTYGALKWRFQTGNAIDSTPLVHEDGTIWFGSQDNSLYVLNDKGDAAALLDSYNLGSDVNAGPTQGSDGSVYVGTANYGCPTCNKIYAHKSITNPPNIENQTFSWDDFSVAEQSDIISSGGDSNNWLNGGPWAIRIEITRSNLPDADGLYAYTLHSWIRKCANATCSDMISTYFADTRVDYEPSLHPPHLSQTAKLCSKDHAAFESFFYGFTQGTGSVAQTAIINNLNFSFIRPGDTVITSDPNWP